MLIYILYMAYIYYVCMLVKGVNLSRKNTLVIFENWRNILGEKLSKKGRSGELSVIGGH